MSEFSATEKLRAMLDERGIEYTTNDFGYCRDTIWDGGAAVQLTRHAGLMMGVTPEQAIAATVGNRTDLAKRLREVTGLHAFAELFGFDWADDSDWTWHDVARAMADAIDAATVGAGTCHMEVKDNLDESEGMGDVWLECDECHWQMPLEPTTPRFKHCPNCGKRIEEVSE